jgi:hypothetical protein
MNGNIKELVDIHKDCTLSYIRKRFVSDSVFSCDPLQSQLSTTPRTSLHVIFHCVVSTEPNPIW